MEQGFKKEVCKKKLRKTQKRANVVKKLREGKGLQMVQRASQKIEDHV